MVQYDGVMDSWAILQRQRGNILYIPTIGAQSSVFWTTVTVTSVGASTATFLLDFFGPSAFLLRFLVISDIMAVVAEIYSRAASSLPLHCDLGFNFFLCQGR